jgi:acetyl-CoA acetyltransferase
VSASADTVVTPGARISGIGETDYVRGTDRTAQQLLIEAAVAACADAGVEPSEVDGLVVPNGKVDAEVYIHGLGIKDLRFHAATSMGGAGTVAAVAIASGALRAGLAERVVVAAGGTQYSGAARLGDVGGSGSAIRWPGQHIRDHLERPYGLSVPMQWYSLHANRWLAETGADRGGMREVALATRAHAARNPKAYFRDRPLSAAAYDASPVLVEPFHLFDICQESDGAAAVLLERDGSEVGSAHRPVRVLGGGEGRADSPDDLLSRPDMLQMGLTKLAPRLLGELGLDLADLDALWLYDCFTFVVLRQLEELGYCARGEAPDFVRERGIGPGGGLPVNTHGGLLSQAHIAGMNHVVEAVRQLRGEAGEAQLPSVELGLVSGYGDMSDGSLLVLARS